jgi:hypothetical protein
MNQKSITQESFNDKDFAIAQEIGRRLGRANGVYTSTSDMIGMQFDKRFNGDTGFFVIKTKEFGFLVVYDLVDLNMEDAFL